MKYFSMIIIFQYGFAELYIRLVNSRDVYRHSLAEVNAEQAQYYQYPSQVGSPIR